LRGYNLERSLKQLEIIFLERCTSREKITETTQNPLEDIM